MDNCIPLFEDREENKPLNLCIGVVIEETEAC